jgi:uncharacterized protein YbjT (DUF2867 family)
MQETANDARVVLLTGATGFVGSRLAPALVRGGRRVRCATRDPARARRTHPALDWIELDLDQRHGVKPALAGVNTAFYLVHGMSQGKGYAERELEAARTFAEEAEAAGLERIVYLGGVAPRDGASRHLRSRLATGRVLKSGRVPVFELRAAMIVGDGSISFRIVRDLAARLPAMLLPRWLANRSQPIGIDDVVFALVQSLDVPIDLAGIYDLPGPEVLSGKDILLRLAELRGTRPWTLGVPVLSPRLSSYWLKFVTGADYQVARELVDGLSSDLLATQREFWELIPRHQRTSFDEAARRALADEHTPHSATSKLVEKAVARIARAPSSR